MMIHCLSRLSIAKEEIKARVTIKQVIEKYTNQTIGRGNIICPFHNEKKASMSVSDKFYYCHACGAKGDVIGFVMQYLHCDFKTALSILDRDFCLGLLGQRISVSQQVAMRKRKQEEERKQLEAAKKHQEYDNICWQYRLCNEAILTFEPYSEPWCYYIDKRTYLEYLIEEGGY